MPLRLLVLLVAATAVLPVSPALGSPSKPFRMDVESPQWAGVTDASYSVTLKNETKTQQLGSADITVPAQLTITNRNGIAGSGNELQLRELAIPPGGSRTFTLGVRMPCVAGNYLWGVLAKQSNDFSGAPGNDLGPVSGTRSTTVNGSCSLRFADQPAGAEKTTQIRADAFVPMSAHLVAVEALDGSPTPQRLTWFTRDINLRLVQSDPGTLTPNPATSSAVGGLASFPSLSIDRSGNYNLRASTAAAGFTGADSNRFQVIDAVGDCSRSNCKADVTGRQSSSSLTATATNGFALLSLNLGTDPRCAGYTPPTSDYYEFGLEGATGDKTIVATYTRTAMKSFRRGQSALEICFAAPRSFTPKIGPPAPFDYDGLALNGAEGFVGLLPDCPVTPAGPCILDRASTGGGGAQVLFFVPAAWGNDPRYH